jgi:hypothetical protein
MKILDCGRCWFSKRKRMAAGAGPDIQYECAHPDRAHAIPKARPMLGVTGLVQLASCPRNK